MTDAATATQPATNVPPPFEPDLELIDHLEGNERTLQRYRKRAAQMLDDASAGRTLER